MMASEWDGRLKTGCPEIDSQHQTLIRLFNALEPLIVNRCPPGDYKELLRDIADIATNHCQAEERHLMRNGYPRLDQHKAEHQRLMVSLNAMVGAAERNALTPEALREELAAWVVHIETDDMAAKAYFIN